ALHPNGSLILTGSEDRTARLWDAKTGQPVGKPLAHETEVRVVAFSELGRWMLTGTEGGTVHLWDTARQEAVHPPFRHGEKPIRAAVFTSESRSARDNADL